MSKNEKLPENIKPEMIGESWYASVCKSEVITDAKEKGCLYFWGNSISSVKIIGV